MADQVLGNVMDEMNKRKQIIYRANHRGIKEMDILLGRYADDFVMQMSAEVLLEFETLMAESDRDLLNWFTGESGVPDKFDTPLFHKILSHTQGKSNSKLPIKY